MLAGASFIIMSTRRKLFFCENTLYPLWLNIMTSWSELNYEILARLWLAKIYFEVLIDNILFPSFLYPTK
jgi:hypothetical protein